MENKNFFQIYSDVLFKNYANFEGRARRREYWGFFLINIIVSFCIGFAGGLVGFEYLGNIYSLAVLLPGIAVGIRRMHDISKSGWYILIPIYNIVLLATAGVSGSNEYGEDPKNPGDEIEMIGESEQGQ